MKARAQKSDRFRVAITSEDSTHVVACLDNVLIALTREPPSVQSVQGFIDHAEKLSARYPDGIAILIVPRAPKPALAPGVPRAVIRAWRQLHPKLVCAAVLIRSTGLAGALQRGLISTVINLRPNSLPVKLSANPYDAAEWIVRHNPRHTGEALALGRAFATFLQEYETPGPDSR